MIKVFNTGEKIESSDLSPQEARGRQLFAHHDKASHCREAILTGRAVGQNNRTPCVSVQLPGQNAKTADPVAL